MEKEKNALLEDLKKVLSVNSVAQRTEDPALPFGPGPREALDRVLEMCQSYGMRTQVVNNMMGYAEYGQGEDLIGILCHLDVVPAGDGWEVDPFDLTLKDGNLYGRGIVDDKGPAIASIHALKELIEEGQAFNKRVRILFGLTEEAGAWIDMDYYVAHEEPISYGFTPDAEFPAIYCEKGIGHVKYTFPKDKTCFEEIHGGNAINMVPSSCQAKLRINGEVKEIKAQGRSAHGSTPWEGENAIYNLMDQVEAPDCQLTRFFHELVKGEIRGESLGGYFKDQESGEISYNFGLIHSTEETIEVDVDIRYPISMNFEDQVAGLAKTLKEAGIEGEVVQTSKEDPVYLDKEGDLIQTLLSAYEKHTGDSSEPKVIGGGTYARAMDRIVAFGPVFPGMLATEHMANECFPLDKMFLIKDIYKDAIQLLLEKEIEF